MKLRSEEEGRAGEPGQKREERDGTTEPKEEKGTRLGLIPDPVEHCAGDTKCYEGKTFEYGKFLLGQFKGAIGRFFQKSSR